MNKRQVGKHLSENQGFTSEAIESSVEKQGLSDRQTSISAGVAPLTMVR